MQKKQGRNINRQMNINKACFRGLFIFATPYNCFTQQSFFFVVLQLGYTILITYTKFYCTKRSLFKPVIKSRYSEHSTPSIKGCRCLISWPCDLAIAYILIGNFLHAQYFDHESLHAQYFDHELYIRRILIFNVLNAPYFDRQFL